MTSAVQDRTLKDVNGDVGDHMHNHIHLTNCIHLKNHVHYKHHSVLADKALTRDLLVLQRSRSLRDPSANPRSLQSPFVDVLCKNGESDNLDNARWYVGAERPTECGTKSGSSHLVTTLSVSEAATSQVSRRKGGTVVANNRRIQNGIRSCERVMSEELDQTSLENVEFLEHGKVLILDSVFRSLNSGDRRVKTKARHRQDRDPETLSDQVKHLTLECDDGSSRIVDNVRQIRVEKMVEERRGKSHSHRSRLIRMKRQRFRGARRNRPSIATREAETHSKMSMVSNSFDKGRAPQVYHVEEKDQEYDVGENVAGVPRNGCGMSRNWSSIHHRGQSFLGMSGRSLSCGLSDTRLEQGGSISEESDIPDIAVMLECSSSSTKCNGEALSQLLGDSESQENIDNATWKHDYSGELGIFNDNLLKQEISYGFASRDKSQRNYHIDIHQNLTHKYMPRTFGDLVGQNLVAKALSNSIIKRKVGLSYVFYGSHGTGKTSCARIFARALNCQALRHSKPCGFCSSCTAHDLGKGRNIREIGPISDNILHGEIDILDDMISTQPQSEYRVLIFDDCDTFSSDSWNEILKLMARSPRHLVFVLVCSSLDVLPHTIISRCQKFFFPKLKDADILNTLQLIATKEELDVDKDALKLIASKSDGSLRDAEMTLEQLSLLGHRISLCLVRELIGLISDEKLVDLLDIALSADTVNTVKNLRYIIESGVEPLALMSQLATVITDILAGSNAFLKGRRRRKFFCQQELTKEHMEKLRQALKTLSEAEKQLRASNDKITWLTAALLQLAPDVHYMQPRFSSDASSNHNPLILNKSSFKGRRRKTDKILCAQVRNSGNVYWNAKLNEITSDEKQFTGDGIISQQMYPASNCKNNINKVQSQSGVHHQIEEIWLEVLEKIPINSIKELIYQEGKLISLSNGAAPTVQLLFNSQLTKCKVEKFIPCILQAFKTVLRSPVTIEIICDSRKFFAADPISLPASQDPSHLDTKPVLLTSSGICRTKSNDVLKLGGKDNSSAGMEHEASPRRVTSEKTPNTTSFQDQTKMKDRKPSHSLVRRKVSLAQIIHHAEVCSQKSGWSRGNAGPVAANLERENLRLEPSSRRLFCWNPPRTSRCKHSPLRIGRRKPDALVKLISCGRCLSGRSSR